MYPYWELDLSREEKIKDPRAVFNIEMLVEDLESKFQEWKIKHPDLVEKYSYENKTASEWMDDYHGYTLNKEKTGYGYYHNPNCKWDWYQIGGRWAGRIQLKEGTVEKRGEKSWMSENKNPYENGKVDSAQIKNIDPKFLEKLVPYAVLNEEGWHEKSRLGWFGASFYEKYCCVVEELTIREITEEFKHDYFGISKPWKGITNEYIIHFIETLHEKYYKDGRIYKLKDNLGNGKTEVTEGLKQCEFFRNKHWAKNFYSRFLENLDLEMYLTYVDFHI